MRRLPVLEIFGPTVQGEGPLIGVPTVFIRFGGTVVDPKNFDPRAMTKIVVPDHEAVIIPPNSYVLGHSVEYFRIPREVVTICVGKSTYACCGIIVNVTPLEPEWEGHITIEISNAAPLPAKVYAGEGHPPGYLLPRRSL